MAAVSNVYKLLLYVLFRSAVIAYITRGRRTMSMFSNGGGK
jgi:hypothetical protein